MMILKSFQDLLVKKNMIFRLNEINMIQTLDIICKNKRAMFPQLMALSVVKRIKTQFN